MKRRSKLHILSQARRLLRASSLRFEAELSSGCCTQISREKKHTLCFIGGVRTDDPAYSHGVRQTVHALFKDTEGK